MKRLTPFAAVLRFSGFRLSQADLEARLDASVERYSLDRGGYAQISIGGNDPDWETINCVLEKHGPAIKMLCGDRDVQSACLDLAWDFREGSALVSYILPAQTAALAGLHSIDVEFSTYLEAP